MTIAVREAHVPGAIAAAGTSAALIAQQVVGKAVRDTLFLSSFEARFLPIAMGSAAILSLGVVLWLSRVLVRRSPAVAMPWLFGGSGIALVFCWAVGVVSPPASALLVYFHTALLGPVLITAFWSLINERFDPHSAKRAVARISGGGTLGGVLGGLAAWRASSVVALPTMLLLLAALNVVCALGSILIRARRHPDPVRSSIEPSTNEGSDAEETAFAVLRKSAFLRNLAYLVSLGSILSALLDYIFSAEAAAALPKGGPLLSFFSLFWLGVGLVSFVLQITLGRIALEKLGLAVSIAVLPGTILLGGAFGLAVPGLVSSAILRGADAVQRNTLFRSAYELLYTPIPEASKRATKALIDVGFDRAGTLVGSLVVIFALRVLATYGAETILLFAVLLTALATLPVVRGLHKGYVQTLEDGLRQAADKLNEHPLATTHVNRPSIELDGTTAARDALIDRVQALDLVPLDGPDLEKKLAVERRPDVASARRAKLAAKAIEARRTAARLSSDQNDLLSGRVDLARTVLLKPSAEIRPLVAFIVPLLAHPELTRDAKRALVRLAMQVTGQLIDALLDNGTRTMIRRRIPRILATCDSQRAVDGLVGGLKDDGFEVRYECSKALLRIVTRNQGMALPRDALVDCILNEVRIETSSNPAAESKLAAELIADRRERRLKHIFAILSIQLDREPLELAFRALHQENQRDRGTALEYLETVLPGNVREALWPFLGAVAPLGQPRPAEEILADLGKAVGIPTTSP